MITFTIKHIYKLLKKRVIVDMLQMAPQFIIGNYRSKNIGKSDDPEKISHGIIILILHQ